MGVWIETYATGKNRQVLWSLLMWECGLKLNTANTRATQLGSLLMWECGLKQQLGPAVCQGYQVTPYVGVWIETTGAHR